LVPTRFDSHGTRCCSAARTSTGWRTSAVKSLCALSASAVMISPDDGAGVDAA
jgi:hypothetical protein